MLLKDINSLKFKLVLNRCVQSILKSSIEFFPVFVTSKNVLFQRILSWKSNFEISPVMTTEKAFVGQSATPIYASSYKKTKDLFLVRIADDQWLHTEMHQDLVLVRSK